MSCFLTRYWGDARNRFAKSEEIFSPAASTFFDLLRIVSAVVVVMEHLASRLFVGYGYLVEPGIWVKLLYLLNLLGSPAVVVFFVLSGVFISRSIYRSALMSKQGFDYARYMTARLSRLWLVLIPALVFTFFVDVVADAHGWVNKGSGFIAFIGNVFFVQTILVPQFGSNAPLWSISNEFWYYVMFPLLVLAALSPTMWRRLVFSGLAILILSFIGPRKAAYFLMWLLGAGLMLLPLRGMGSWWSFVASLAALVVFSLIRPLVARSRLVFEGMDIDVFWPDLFIAFAALVVMRNAVLVLRDRQYFISSKFDGLIRRGAAFSFSLYVIHYPLINSGFFFANAKGFDGLQPGLLGFAVEICIVALICVCAWVFASLTERHTDTVRAGVSRALLRVSRREI